MDALTEWLMTATGIALALAVLMTAAWAARTSSVVGTPIHRRMAPRRTQLLWILALLATGALVILTGLIPPAPALLVLGTAAALVASLPRPEDSVLGEVGVRSGWFARRFGELEEWRLTGDHLRWRVGETWLSSSVPADRQLALREQLERACPERESRFRY